MSYGALEQRSSRRAEPPQAMTSFAVERPSNVYGSVRTLQLRDIRRALNSEAGHPLRGFRPTWTLTHLARVEPSRHRERSKKTGRASGPFFVPGCGAT
jgi:hypothetical protein